MSERRVDTQQIKSAEAARQGETPGVVRWMLLISTIAAVVAMIVAYWVVRGF